MTSVFPRGRPCLMSDTGVAIAMENVSPRLSRARPSRVANRRFNSFQACSASVRVPRKSRNHILLSACAPPDAMRSSILAILMRNVCVTRMARIIVCKRRVRGSERMTANCGQSGLTEASPNFAPETALVVTGLARAGHMAVRPVGILKGVSLLRSGRSFDTPPWKQDVQPVISSTFAPAAI